MAFFDIISSTSMALLLQKKDFIRLMNSVSNNIVQYTITNISKGHLIYNNKDFSCLGLPELERPIGYLPKWWL